MLATLYLGPIDRTPTEIWTLWDNQITGVVADKGYSGSHIGMILPSGLTKETTDLCLWAFESGFRQGQDDGKRDLQRDLKRLLEIG